MWLLSPSNVICFLLFLLLSFWALIIIHMFINLTQIPLTKSLPYGIQAYYVLAVWVLLRGVCMCVFACEWQSGNPITFSLNSPDARGGIESGTEERDLDGCTNSRI